MSERVWGSGGNPFLHTLSSKLIIYYLFYICYSYIHIYMYVCLVSLEIISSQGSCLRTCISCLHLWNGTKTGIASSFLTKLLLLFCYNLIAFFLHRSPVNLCLSLYCICILLFIIIIILYLQSLYIFIYLYIYVCNDDVSWLNWLFAY